MLSQPLADLIPFVLDGQVLMSPAGRDDDPRPSCSVRGRQINREGWIVNIGDSAR